MNYLKKRDNILNRFYTYLKSSEGLLSQNNLTVSWFGYGGRDDDYIQFDLKSHHDIPVKLTILFWLNLAEFDERAIYATYFCYTKSNSDAIHTYFEGRILFKDIEEQSLEAKVIFALKEVLSKYKSVMLKN